MIDFATAESYSNGSSTTNEHVAYKEVVKIVSIIYFWLEEN